MKNGVYCCQLAIPDILIIIVFGGCSINLIIPAVVGVVFNDWPKIDDNDYNLI